MTAPRAARAFGAALAAAAAALAVGGVLVWLVGDSPLFFFRLVGESAFGSREGLAYTAFYATPLVFTGLAVALAYRCGLLNIGAEGQMVMGALASAAAALSMPDTPAAVAVAILAGVIAGALW